METTVINIVRLQQMHKLIQKKRTGCPDTFAKILGISKSMLMINLNQLKQLGGPIKYSFQNESYYYEEDCEFLFGYEIRGKDLMKIKGGMSLKISHYNNIRIENNFLYSRKEF